MAEHHSTIEFLHIASQYLAAAGISEVPKSDDDSHTNLGWSVDKKCLITRTFCKKNEALALYVNEFALEWIVNNEIQSRLPLDGLYHEDILKWIDKMARESVDDIQYQYQFHYDLPYCKLENDFQFKKPRQNELNEFSELLNVAHVAFSRFLELNNLSSEIRVWPHHFDMGLYAVVDKKSDLHVGAGLAMPDTVIEDCYFYVSGWEDGKSLSTEGLHKLDIGEWKNDGFMGAVLAAPDVDEQRVVQFMNAALAQFKFEVLASK